jgi:uncharacterized membrane protein YeaQ/YmgE (transglycosylase-associated protein family)
MLETLLKHYRMFSSDWLVRSFSNGSGCSRASADSMQEDVISETKERAMSYLIWIMIGVVIAVVAGTQTRRRLFRSNTPILASAFGATIGGVIGDGVSHPHTGDVTFASLIGAILGALIFCWAVRERASDSEP